MAQALLSVTDARAAASGRPTVIKAYGSVRGSAVKHVEAALPRVGDLVHEVRGLTTQRQRAPRLQASVLLLQAA